MDIDKKGIKVGDRVTYSFENSRLTYNDDTFKWKPLIETHVVIITQDNFNFNLNSCRIKKVERIGSNGWYTVYEKEKKKELLTYEEREFLKSYIKFCGKRIESIKKDKNYIIFYFNVLAINIEASNFYYYKSFESLTDGKIYTLSELGLES